MKRHSLLNKFISLVMVFIASVIGVIAYGKSMKNKYKNPFLAMLLDCNSNSSDCSIDVTEDFELTFVIISWLFTLLSIIGVIIKVTSFLKGFKTNSNIDVAFHVSAAISLFVGGYCMLTAVSLFEAFLRKRLMIQFSNNSDSSASRTFYSFMEINRSNEKVAAASLSMVAGIFNLFAAVASSAYTYNNVDEDTVSRPSELEPIESHEIEPHGDDVVQDPRWPYSSQPEPVG